MHSFPSCESLHSPRETCKYSATQESRGLHNATSQDLIPSARGTVQHYSENCRGRADGSGPEKVLTSTAAASHGPNFYARTIAARRKRRCHDKELSQNPEALSAAATDGPKVYARDSQIRISESEVPVSQDAAKGHASNHRVDPRSRRGENGPRDRPDYGNTATKRKDYRKRERRLRDKDCVIHTLVWVLLQVLPPNDFLQTGWLASPEITVKG